MRRNKLYSIVALLASALSPVAAHAQLKDTVYTRPAMMLLVDTSGSMERKPDTATCVDCLPSCTGNASTDERNRWAITLEALTGSFSTFKCSKKDRSTAYAGQYDAQYFLPHYDFSASTQVDDGVLTAYGTRMKFALMTFDGVLTTVNGNTLVPFTQYGNDSAFRSKLHAMDGMYSYPPQAGSYGWKKLSFPGCSAVYGVNGGARAEGTNPGDMISFVAPEAENASTLSANVSAIRSSLLNVRPYGGTPIPAMLDDLVYYLKNDPDISKAGDGFYDCRPRYGILLTDGAPDALFRGGEFNCQDTTKNASCAGGECLCPYDTADQIAGSLVSQGLLDALYVVAFNVNDTVARAALDQIAKQGATDKAIQASDLATLRTALAEIMDQSSPDATSRSVPVVINNGRALQFDSGRQFQITSGFVIPQATDLPWEGRLWRQRTLCNGANPAPQDIDSSKGDAFHVTLNQRDGNTRTIQTVAPLVTHTLGSLYRAAPGSANILVGKLNMRRPDGGTFGAYLEPGSAEPRQGLEQWGLDSMSSMDTSFTSAYWGANNTTRTKITNYLRGLPSGSTRAARKLGDIYHSNPVVLPPVFPGSDLLNTYDPQQRAFYMNLLDTTKPARPSNNYDPKVGRPGVVFVATNDGILHAFNLDTWTDKAGNTFPAGYEFWGFVPPALFGVLPTVAQPNHLFTFDGTPVVRDMILSKPNNGVATMGTVLLVALRGGNGYVAMDVTWPEKPQFLWQRSFPLMGNTVGTPALAHVKIQWNGTATTRAVAILPGGTGLLSNANSSCDVNVYGRGEPLNGSPRQKMRCWQANGRSLYVVDVLTGELIQEFDGRHFHSPLTGSVAVDGEELSLSRAAYFTDEDGVLWRLSMAGTDPSQWRVVPLWDIYGGEATTWDGSKVTVATPAWKMGRPSPYPPLVTRDPATGNVNILVGTGDVDNLADVAANRVVSLKETRRYLGNDELDVARGDVTPHWILQLDPGEAVTGPLLLLDENVYFTSFTGPGAAADKCTMGTSRVIGGSARLTQSNGLPLAALPSETSPTAPKVLWYYPQDTATKESLLMGLSIAREPVCVEGSATNDPLAPGGQRFTQTGRMGGGEFVMRTMVAGKGGTPMGGTAASSAGGAQRQYKQTLPISNTARSVGWASSIE